MPETLLRRALKRAPVERTPVWLMRQAGRYLPEYRELRAKAGDFLTLASTPELAAAVTLQPLERYALDAAIIFSDILIIPHAMGLGLHFVPGEGPRFANTVRDLDAVERLPVSDTEQEIPYLLEALERVRGKLAPEKSLIGFAGSPWTVATYMVEGGSSRTFPETKKLLYREPATLHALLAKLTAATTDYLLAQVKAGADVLMVFDTWGGALTPGAYRAFSLEYMKRIVENIGDAAPVILFTKGGGGWLEAMAETGCAALGVDWTIDLADARARVGDKVALQGNLDPSILLATPDTVRASVAGILESYGHGSGHVFNLGHGITPDVDPRNVAALIDAVHDISPRYHS